MKRLSFLTLCLTLILSYLNAPAHASKSDIPLLSIEEEETFTSGTREDRPIGVTAEDITIITADEIEKMNAHTLTDVLNHIPGIQMEIRGGPGSVTMAHIMGSSGRHVKVLIDGVEYNNLSNNTADLGTIPVQHIQKIEIIKDPASSVWGSALGGVIHIITKKWGGRGRPRFKIHTSYGEEDTYDMRFDVRGKTEDIGLYLGVGKLHTSGLRSKNGVSQENIYTNMEWEAGEDTTLSLLMSYNRGERDFGEFVDFDLSLDNDFTYRHAILSLESYLSESIKLTLSLRYLGLDFHLPIRQLSTGVEISTNRTHDDTMGGEIRLLAETGPHRIVIGAEYDDGDVESNAIAGNEATRDEWGIYINDTLQYGKWAFTLGLRHDNSNIDNQDFTSPSLGITYRYSQNTILRLFCQRGFSYAGLLYYYDFNPLLIPNKDLDVEKVLSYQIGIEWVIPGRILLKGFLFRHEVDDAIESFTFPDGTFTYINKKEVTRTGLDLEFHTNLWQPTELFGGITLTDIRDQKTASRIRNQARSTLDIGLKHIHARWFTFLLTGHYVWWHGDAANRGKYSAMIWDFHFRSTLYEKGKPGWIKGQVGNAVLFERKANRLETKVDFFVSLRNLFNGSQYLYGAYKNPRRWIEGGVTISF